MTTTQSIAIATCLTVLATVGGLAYAYWPVKPSPPPLTVTLRADTSQFEAAMRKVRFDFETFSAGIGAILLPVFAQAASNMTEFGETLRRVGQIIAGVPPWTLDPKLREVHVAGLCAKMQVRAGYDPRYADPDMLTFLIVQIAHEPNLTAAERGLIQAAAIRGWNARNPEEPAMPIYHQLIGDTQVVIGRA